MDGNETWLTRLFAAAMARRSKEAIRRASASSRVPAAEIDALVVSSAPLAAQTPTAKTPAEQVQAALKDAKGTKLVLLGTAPARAARAQNAPGK